MNRTSILDSADIKAVSERLHKVMQHALFTTTVKELGKTEAPTPKAKSRFWVKSQTAITKFQCTTTVKEGVEQHKDHSPKAAKSRASFDHDKQSFKANNSEKPEKKKGTSGA